MKYRVTDQTIEAFQMTRERRLDNSEWPDWLHEAWQKPLVEVGSMFCASDGCLAGGECVPLFLHTLKGMEEIHRDNYIVKDDRDNLYGGLYSCSQKGFENTYTAVNNGPREELLYVGDLEAARQIDGTIRLCNPGTCLAYQIAARYSKPLDHSDACHCVECDKARAEDVR